jgi:small subunit ribosomal protein S18
VSQKWDAGALFTLLFITMRNIEKLKQFITEQGKIIPQKQTGLTTKQQRQVKKHIKQARILGLLPFVLLK